MKKCFLLLIPILLSASACSENDPSEVTFSLKQFQDKVSFHTEEQIQFFNDADLESNLTEYGMGEEEKTRPLPIKLEWDVIKAKKYTVRVSENSDMSDAWVFTSRTDEFDLYNCKLDTTYYWTVEAHYKSNSFISEPSSFTTTNEGIRNIYIDGVNNVRDLGGYELPNNKTFKQGMIYRSAKLNESNLDKIVNTITSSGIDVAINQLGIKSDIDLREIEPDDEGKIETSGLSKSPLGENVNYVNCPMYYEGSTVISHTSSKKDAYNKANIKKMFDYLANENNYPIVFHCTQGKDRTGAIAYLLEALLGMSHEDMAHDYLFTNMSSMGGGACKYETITFGYNLVLRPYEGDDISQKAMSYLLDIGVSQTNIDSIINILSE